MEAEGREIHRVQPLDEHSLLSLADEPPAIVEAGDERRVEQQAHVANSSSSSDGLSSGASCWYVH